MKIKKSFSQGFSLVELLVAMAIALIVLTGVVSSFLASKTAYLYTDELAYMQENGRFAIDRLTRDIREAGNYGCSNNGASGVIYAPNNLVSLLKTSTSTFYGKKIGLSGFDHTQASSSFPSEITLDSPNYSDAVVVRRADIDHRLVVSAHSASAGTFTVVQTLSPTTNNYAAGTIMVAVEANCQHQAIFQVNAPATPTLNVLTYTAPVTPTTTPGNCTQFIKGARNKSTCPSAGSGKWCNGDCSAADSCSVLSCKWNDHRAPGSPDTDFVADSALYPLSSNIYYIHRSSADATTPALWIDSLPLNYTGATPVPQELVTGVEYMAITYGVDTDATPDGLANRYVAANTITADEPTSASVAPILAWNRVVSVRVQLVMRSRNDVLTKNSTFNLASCAPSLTGLTNPTDRKLRQCISTTIQLRDPFKG